MSEKHNDNHGPSLRRPTDVLILIEKRAVSIRKVLRSMESCSGQEAWKGMDDAVKLAEHIEAIASHARSLSAADASDAVELLELLQEQLQRTLHCILAS